MMNKEKDISILVRVAISTSVLIFNLYIAISIFHYGYIYLYEDNKGWLFFEIILIFTGIILNFNGLKIFLSEVSKTKKTLKIEPEPVQNIFIDGLIKSVENELNDDK